MTAHGARTPRFQTSLRRPRKDARYGTEQQERLLEAVIWQIWWFQGQVVGRQVIGVQGQILREVLKQIERLQGQVLRRFVRKILEQVGRIQGRWFAVVGFVELLVGIRRLQGKVLSEVRLGEFVICIERLQGRRIPVFRIVSLVGLWVGRPQGHIRLEVRHRQAFVGFQRL